MKAKDLIPAILGFMFLTPVFFTSCEEGGNGTSTRDTIVSVDTIYSSDTIFSIDTIFSSDTVYMADKNVFMLDFAHSADPDDNEIGVSFAMSVNNISEIPHIEVNGTPIKDFHTYGPVLYGNLDVAYGKSVQYSVSKGDSTTSGTFIMPEITEGTVNDTSILGRYAVEIPVKDRFDFYVEFDDADFTRIILDEDKAWMDKKNWTTTNQTYSLSIDTTDAVINYAGNYEAELHDLDFRSVKGVGPLSSGLGLAPNVSGEFGSGYVSANEYFRPTWVEMNPSLKSSVKSEPKPGREKQELRMSGKEFIRAYKNMIKNSHFNK